MPPFVQSANWQTLARQAGRLLTRVKPPNINTIKTSLPRKVARVIRQSFPSLSTPAHLLELNPAYAFTSSAPNQLSRGFNKAVTLNRLQQPFTQASRGIRTAARRPTTTPFASNVGLGTARSYSAGPQQAFHGKVPLALRALAHLVDQDTDKSLPLPAQYKPYHMPKKLSRTGRRSARISYSSIDSVKTSRHAERDRLFPRASTVDVNLPENRLQPERLVTSGINTTLTVAVGRSYHEIFETHATGPAEPFEPRDLGVTVFPDLWQDMMAAGIEIGNNAAARHLQAVWSKLEALGVTDINREGEFARVEHWFAPGREEFYLKFWDRSEMDIRKIIGESLRPREEGWILREERAIRVVSPAEALAALAAWEEAQRPNWPRPIDNSDLIMPLIDIEVASMSTQNFQDDSAIWNGWELDDDLDEIDFVHNVMEPDFIHEDMEDFENEWSD